MMRDVSVSHIKSDTLDRYRGGINRKQNVDVNLDVAEMNVVFDDIITSYKNQTNQAKRIFSAKNALYTLCAGIFAAFAMICTGLSGFFRGGMCLAWFVWVYRKLITKTLYKFPFLCYNIHIINKEVDKVEGGNHLITHQPKKGHSKADHQSCAEN